MLLALVRLSHAPFFKEIAVAAHAYIGYMRALSFKAYIYPGNTVQVVSLLKDITALPAAVGKQIARQGAIGGSGCRFLVNSAYRCKITAYRSALSVIYKRKSMDSDYIFRSAYVSYSLQVRG